MSEDRPVSRVLFQSESVLMGDERCPASHELFGREDVNCSWPCIVFPRLPIGIRHERFGDVIGDSNTAVVYNVGRTCRRRALAPGGSRHDWLDVHPRVLAEMIAEFDPGAPDRGDDVFEWGDAPIPGAACLAQRVAQRRAVSGCVDPLEVEEGALAAARAVVAAGYRARGQRARRARSEAHARFHREAVEEVRSILLRRMSERPTLAELSRAVHVSQFHLCRIFRRETGASIHGYLNDLRLRRAMDLIECGGWTMAQIALAVGYVSESHFSDAFKRVLGVRPSEFRTGLNGGDRTRKSAPIREPESLALRGICRAPGP